MICIYALVVGVLIYRDLKVREFGAVFYNAAKTSAVILFLLAAAGPLPLLMSESHIATRIAEEILGISSDPLMVLLVVNLLLLLVGTVFEPLPALVCRADDAADSGAGGHRPDPVCHGRYLNLMIGMLHPPVGLLILITAAIGRLQLWSVAVETLSFFGLIVGVGSDLNLSVSGELVA